MTLTSGLEPMIQFACSVAEHWDGLVHWFHSKSPTASLKGPDSTAPCYATACTASYQYDPRDRLVHEDNGHGGLTDYTLDGASNVLTESQSGTTTSTRTSEYLGNQLQQVTTTGPNQATSVQRYFYDPLGNLQCVTTGAGSQRDCNVATGGTPTAALLAYNTYDYLNRLIGYHAYTGGNRHHRHQHGDL